ncbi:cubilin-like isoform X2 [Haliotis asinina]|uniref:cubilin-like isoform X2 n=1 Tax=Haliotis asinina TaxID=109174 RepID=UPI0035326BF4
MKQDHNTAHVCMVTRRVDGCAGHVELAATVQQASIFSTNYPSSYDNGASCSWRLYPMTTGARVYVEVVDVDLDDTHGVCSDNLTLYSGADDGGSMLERLCGRPAPTLVKSEPGGSMYMSFTTDSAIVGRGFALRFWEVNEGDGGVNYPRCIPGTVQTVGIGATPVRLELPDYSAGGSTCNFQLETDEANVLLLRPVSRTTAADINCTTDHITVYDGSSNNSAPIALWCTETGFTTVYSSGSSLLLQTRLAQRVNSRSPAQLGLMVYRQLKASGSCDSSVFPTVQIPFSPVYMWIPFSFRQDGQSCPVSAGIHSLGPSSSLVITVLGSTSMTPPKCGVNYIQVSSYADTMGFLHQPKCSDEGQPYYRAEETELVIGQAMDGPGVRYLVEVKAEGYRCKEKTNDIMVSGQTNTLRMDLPVFQGTASSAQCTFRLKAIGTDNLVSLTFKDSNLVRREGVQCRGEHFVVYDGYNRSSPRLGEYCGQRFTRPPVFTSTSAYLFVELIASTAGHFVHVTWEYSAVEDNRCSGTTDLESSGKDQFLESPGYPTSYARNLTCLYLVTSPGGHAVTLELLDHSLPADCSDNITVFDGNSTTSPVLASWCTSSNTTLTSSNSAILLKFTSNPHSETSRFRVRYVDDVPKFASPEDPRVLPAIAAVVGLANSVGLVFLVSATCCYYRNRAQKDQMVIEKHLDLADEETKESQQ